VMARRRQLLWGVLLSDQVGRLLPSALHVDPGQADEDVLSADRVQLTEPVHDLRDALLYEVHPHAKRVDRGVSREVAGSQVAQQNTK
jgi:hypothetical protein